jgi:hypothetical protein
MDFIKRIGISLSVFVVGTLIFCGYGFTSNTVAPKTLDRWVDPVVMEGSMVSEMIGKPIENLRLYAFRDGKFEPIRYQIDEMIEGGDWVLPSGPITNKELGNGVLDTRDKILFMARELGDKASDAALPGSKQSAEIELVDPLTGEKAWCYLFCFESNVPARSSKTDYVRYNYAAERVESDYWGEEYIITKDGRHTTYYKSHWMTKAAGGNEKNHIDRLKIRINLNLLFSSLSIKLNEEQLQSNVVGYKQGPIRVIRRVEQYKRIPGGMKAVRVVTDVLYYSNTITVPVLVNIPFQLDKLLTSAVVNFGTDYNETASGSYLYNSNNLQGIYVDGKMDDGEKNVKPEMDAWRLITGPIGTHMTRTILPPEFKKDVSVKINVIDDADFKNPPETYPGTYGCIWQSWDVSKLKRGKYYLNLEFYVIPNYKLGDEKGYVNYMDHALRIRCGTQEKVSQPLFIPTLGKKYL